MKKKLFSKTIVFISILILLSCFWTYYVFGVLEIDRILFIMKTSLADGEEAGLGNSGNLVFSYICNALIPTIVVYIPIYFFIFKELRYSLFIKISKFKEFDLFKTLYNYSLMFSICLFIVTTYLGFTKLDFIEQIKRMNITSTFMEDNYINPKEVNLEFPDNKKNVIHLFLESMESSYKAVEDGGVLYENIIPNLTNYEKEGISFNYNGEGIRQVRGATFTAAGMASQTSGLPFISPISDGNLYGTFGEFMPGAYTLGEVLDKEGYDQTLFLGSDASFGGRDIYFTTHGNFKIKDYKYFKEQKLISEDYKVWWGVEDSKYFEFAKKELLETSKSDKPFNFTMLTTNSHFEDGLVEDGCEIKFNNQYMDAIYCNDQMIYDFIEWVKKQDFYKDTIIVITGDHLTMDRDFFNNTNPDYVRTQYNVILNSDYDMIDEYNKRSFYAMDMFPTILGAMNVKIEGDKMALGTNLFSKEKTLVENYGLEYIDNEFYYRSKFYTNDILQLN